MTTPLVIAKIVVREGSGYLYQYIDSDGQQHFDYYYPLRPELCVFEDWLQAQPPERMVKFILLTDDWRTDSILAKLYQQLLESPTHSCTTCHRLFTTQEYNPVTKKYDWFCSGHPEVKAAPEHVGLNFAELWRERLRTGKFEPLELRQFTPKKKVHFADLDTEEIPPDRKLPSHPNAVINHQQLCTSYQWTGLRKDCKTIVRQPHDGPRFLRGDWLWERRF